MDNKTYEVNVKFNGQTLRIRKMYDNEVIDDKTLCTCPRDHYFGYDEDPRKTRLYMSQSQGELVSEHSVRDYYHIESKFF